MATAERNETRRDGTSLVVRGVHLDRLHPELEDHLGEEIWAGVSSEGDRRILVVHRPFARGYSGWKVRLSIPASDQDLALGIEWQSVAFGTGHTLEAAVEALRQQVCELVRAAVLVTGRAA